jgi:nucleoside-diphosphate-sugar epimerase
MRVTITGGAGSLGREVSLALAGAGHRVCVLDLAQCDFTALEAVPAIEIVRGSIEDVLVLRQAVQGADVVLHLAALLPPASERDRERTMEVNVGGTARLLDAATRVAPRTHIVFSSSVCVYGNTSAVECPIPITLPPRPTDLYGESKAAAEALVHESGLPYTSLRISGIAVPALLAPPAVWPFQRKQRIEFVSRGDVVAALLACVGAGPANAVLNIAGGPTWQMTGEAYVARWNEALGLAFEDANYLQQPGTFDWYDTAASQHWLGYQRTSFERFGALLDAAIAQALD